MVATPTLWRPTSVTGLILSAGTIGTVAGSSFFIKVHEADIDNYTEVREITGDGDSAPRSVPNYYLYSNWLIRGWCVSGQAIGIANLKSTTLNPTGTVLVQFNTANDGTARGFKGNFVVGRIRLRWIRTAPYIPLAMQLVATNTDADGTANYTETL